MIKKSITFVLLAGLTVTFVQHTSRSAKALAPSLTVGFLNQAGNPSIDAFWKRFKSAVMKSDKAAIATMSGFPIEMPYGIASIKTRSQLIRRYRELFNVQADARKCFVDAQPVIEPSDKNRFTVGCRDSAGNEVVIYGFVRTRTGWKLKSLDNINE